MIRADFDVEFKFVGMAEEEPDRGVAEQLLQRAEDMLKDVETRLLRMTVAQREAFEPRCAELREAINKARIDD